jgi:hypothetical protein
VREFLAQHRNVEFHFTPIDSSWLNQVEIWFSRLQREVIDRGIFTSVADLSRKVLRYIRLYGKSAKAVPLEVFQRPPSNPCMIKILRGQPTSGLCLNKHLAMGRRLKGICPFGADRLVLSEEEKREL